MASATLPKPRRRSAPTRTLPYRAAKTTLLKKPSRLDRPILILGVLLATNLGLYVTTVIQEANLSRWKGKLAAQRQANVQLRTSLSSARSVSSVDNRARSLGLVKPPLIAYLPKMPPPPASRRHDPIAIGAAEGY